MVLLCLTMISHKDIGRKAAVGDDTTDSIHTIKVPFTGVFPVHQSQNTVATTLNGQVDMLAHIGHLCDNAQRLIAHILGMGCGESHTHLWCRLCHHAEQLWECHVETIGCGMIGIDILS